MDTDEPITWTAAFAWALLVGATMYSVGHVIGAARGFRAGVDQGHGIGIVLGRIEGTRQTRKAAMRAMYTRTGDERLQTDIDGTLK